MPAAKIIQLRELLSGRFPRLHSRPAALRPMEECLGVNLPPAALTEVVAEKPGAGSGLFRDALMQHAFRENQLVALVDGRDSFDAAGFDADLSRLLWVRCRSAHEALKAADLLLRDRNLPLVLLDLAANHVAQVRQIPATTWYRFQRLVEHTSAVCLVLTPCATVGPARVRMVLSARFSLAALEKNRDALLTELKAHLSETWRSGAVREPLQNTA